MAVEIIWAVETIWAVVETTWVVAETTWVVVETTWVVVETTWLVMVRLLVMQTLDLLQLVPLVFQMVARVRFAPPHTRSDRRLLPFSTSRMDRTPCSRTGRLASKASTRLRLPLRCASRVVLIRKESLTARSLPFRVNSTLILSSQLMDSDPARFILLALSLLSLETRLVPSGSLETVLDATLDLHLLFQMELLDLLPLLSQLPYHHLEA